MTSKQFVVQVHAEVYATLAEALAEPPVWLAGGGPDWPLFDVAIRLARDSDSEAAVRAVEGLAAIEPEVLATRCERYQQLFAGAGRPCLWLYESLYVDGRLFGPATLAVEQIYRAAGLAAAGAELPDHAALELTFLGWLAEQEASNRTQAAEWQKLAQSFIKQHAGRWLPDLGRAMAASGDPVYGPIGQFLADWLAEMARPSRRQGKIGWRMPVLPKVEACTLCGFCVQVCPTQALILRETNLETGLILNPAACVGCAKCERICEFEALKMELQASAQTDPLVLCISSRATCSACGQATVSQAELQTIAATLGEWPPWLDYCLECRTMLMERI